MDHWLRTSARRLLVGWAAQAGQIDLRQGEPLAHDAAVNSTAFSRMNGFPGRGPGGHLTTRQYARLLAQWLGMIGLDPCLYGTHSLRRTKETLIYKKTGDLRAVQLLLGHTKTESTVRYLGIEVDDALAVAEQIDGRKLGQSRHALPLNPCLPVPSADIKVACPSTKAPDLRSAREPCVRCFGT